MASWSYWEPVKSPSPWVCPGLFSISYSCNMFITAATGNKLLLPRPLCHSSGAEEALKTRKVWGKWPFPSVHSALWEGVYSTCSHWGSPPHCLPLASKPS